MEPTNNIIANLASDAKISDLIGNWFLYSFSLFVELSITLLCSVVIYHVGRSIAATRKFARGACPINIYKWLLVLISTTLWLRSSMDAVALLIWDEVTMAHLQILLNIDRLFNALALIPFIAFIYLLLRAGPVLEFQLLRQPIPTNLDPTWKTLKKPVYSFITMLVLSVVITLSKLA